MQAPLAHPCHWSPSLGGWDVPGIWAGMPLGSEFLPGQAGTYPTFKNPWTPAGKRGVLEDPPTQVAKDGKYPNREDTPA